MTGSPEVHAPHSGSLRLRFLLAITLWVALGIGAVWYSATRVFASHIEQSYHEELEVHVRELARLTRLDAEGNPELMRPLSDPRYEVPLSGFYWEVTVPGKPPLQSESMTRGRLDEAVAHSHEIAHAVEQGPTGPAITYGFVRPGPDGEEVHFVIATDQAELDRIITSFTRELTLWLVALAALLMATGIAVISYGLKPLGRLGAAISRIRAGEATRLEGRYPSEIAPLVQDLNEYIRQNGEMIRRARAQAGNLAHSLRTPLAVVMDEAERLAREEQCARAAAVLLEQSQMMQQQIEYQLARARSAAGARVPGAISTLPGLLLPILNAMKRLHPEKRFECSNLFGGEITLPVDPVNLSELVSILLDNAGKWARSKAVITLEPEGEEGVHIRIADDGPGMSDEELAKAFDVGTRFDPERPGSGLGLAIARDICETIGARLELVSTGKGLEAHLWLEGRA